jgi:hypothetical protein
LGVLPEHVICNVEHVLLLHTVFPLHAVPMLLLVQPQYWLLVAGSTQANVELPVLQ